MDLIADILLGVGAISAGLYCLVLGRRLNRFNDLEKGVGGAVAVLSAQVDDLNKTLDAARNAAEVSAKTLTDLTDRAEDTSRRLELQMASLHDLPPAESVSKTEPPKQDHQVSPPAQAGPMFTRRRLMEGHV